MSTDFEIDESTMQAAMDASGLRTKKEVMEAAMREFIANRVTRDGRRRVVLPSGYIMETPSEDAQQAARIAREALASLRGKIRFADGYDPKAPYLATEKGAQRAARDALKALARFRRKKRVADSKALRKSPVLADE